MNDENNCSALYLADMHCHLDFAADGFAIAQHASWPMITMTVDPRDYRRVSSACSKLPHVRVGAGLHPWRIASGTCGTDEVALLVETTRQARFIGEVGLDFAKRHAGTEDRQVAAFDAVVRSCACQGDKVLSIHALRSASTVLDVLQHHDAPCTCTCILHWFSGSNPELHRAIDLGCWFSVNERMLAAGRGREYAKVIPHDRLLLETDLPSRAGDPCTAHLLRASLESALALLEEARQEPCRALVARNSAAVLS